jgi:hypothetical protein
MQMLPQDHSVARGSRPSDDRAVLGIGTSFQHTAEIVNGVQLIIRCELYMANVHLFQPDSYIALLLSPFCRFVLSSFYYMVFDCRFCSEIPLSNWLGITGKTPIANKQPSRAQPKPSKRQVDKFERRTLDQISEVVASWEPYVHPRAREFFPSHEMLIGVLTQIAKSVHRTEDPILGSDSQCCYWFGEVTKDDPQQACIRMVKPGETNESTTFVNRVLVFIFATDESFEQLMRLPKEPFRMSCCDQLCVNLNHISVD